MPKESESIINERERRVAEARSRNLLSNTFMTVPLDDKLALRTEGNLWIGKDFV